MRHSHRRLDIRSGPVLAWIGVLSLAIGILTAPVPAAALGAGAVDQSTDIRTAAVTGFDPGNIISDALFYDSNAMSAAQIQSFLDQRIGSCANGRCINVLQAGVSSRGDVVSARTGNVVCRGFNGGTMSVAELIYRVQVACGISAKAILVTLQKEQGLVTSRAPSDWNLRAAMGASCPDTAPCDPAYAGIGPQIVAGTTQLKTYMAGAFSRQPGRHFIGYHPNAGCGGTDVSITNYASAALYNYTPYQPNAAALAAGYGTGDGCSSYGNRNFYQYYSDWFGSTQSAQATIVRSASSPDVYLVSGQTRWHITDGEDYGELDRAFGPTAVVSDAYIARLSNGGTTTAVLRNADTGVMALIQEGQSHRFGSCEAVASWGASCANPTSVAASVFNRASVGETVGAFFRLRSSDRWGRFEAGSTVTPLYNSAAARAVNGDPRAPIYAPYLTSARYAQLAKGRLLFAPTQLVKTTQDSRVYFTSGFDKLRWVESWAAAVEYNRLPSSLATVEPGELAGYTVDGKVEPTITCDGTTYFPAAGWLYALAAPQRAGLQSMAVSAPTCAQFTVAPVRIAQDLAVKIASSPDVHVISSGQSRQVLTWSGLLARNAGSAPPIISIADSTLASLPRGPLVADGEVVKRTDSADIHVVSGEAGLRVPSMGVLGDLGLGSTVRVYSADRAAFSTDGGTLGIWVSCNGRSFVAAAGAIREVPNEVASTFNASALSNTVCGRLVETPGKLQAVVIRPAGSSDLYVAEAGKLRHITSWSAYLSLGSGAPTPYLTVSLDSFRTMQVGEPIG